MNRRTGKAAALALALLYGTGQAAAEGFHLPGGRNTNWPWSMTDSAGYRWDISANGQVDDGTNDCYDGGMLLRVGGSGFSWSSPGKLSADGQEVEIGPWSHGSLRVWRRIYVDKKVGYCRWIDLFENTAASAQTAAIQYYTNMGGSTYMTYSTSGQADLTPKDWGIITSSASGSSRPSVVHVFATRTSKLKPRFQWSRGNDNVYYHVSLNIPAGKTVALCFFEAQRRPYSEAQKFLKAFKPEKELRKVPSVLRRIILNMGGAVLTLGRLELPRSDKYDLVVLRNGNELLGTIANQEYGVEAFFGKLTLPAGRVIGLSVPIESERIELGLIDGQVICGRLLDAPLKLKLATGGSEMELPPAKIRTASYRLSPSRPDEIAITQPMILLRSGEQLYFNPDDADLSFHTRYGDVKLSPDCVKTICLDTPEGGLHRAVFRNGSVLSGLLNVVDLKLPLQLGSTLSIRRHVIERFIFPGADPGGAEPAGMKLRNDDELLGRIVDKALTVKTRFGEVVVAPKEIAELIFPEASLGRAQIKLHNGTTISGRFVGESVRFQIGSGPTLAVSIGHIQTITGAKPKEAGGTKPPPKPPPKPPQPPVIRWRTERARPRQDQPQEKVEREETAAKAARRAAERARRIEIARRAVAAKKEQMAAAKIAREPVAAEPAKAAGTRPAPKAARAGPAAAEIKALAAKRGALLQELARVRAQLTASPGQAEAASTKQRLDTLEQQLAVATKDLVDAHRRLAAPKEPTTAPGKQRAAQPQRRQPPARATDLHLACTKCGHQFTKSFRGLAQGGPEEGVFEEMGIVQLDCPKCAAKKCCLPMVKCPKCGKHYLGESIKQKAALLKGPAPPGRTKPVRDICPHCKQDRMEWLRKKYREWYLKKYPPGKKSK